MQSISETEGKLNVIANNMGKYISFSIGQLRFIDSLQFLNASLENLVESNDSFPITKKNEPDLNKVGLLLKQGIHPYTSTWKISNVLKKRVLKKSSFL